MPLNGNSDREIAEYFTRWYLNKHLINSLLLSRQAFYPEKSPRFDIPQGNRARKPRYVKHLFLLAVIAPNNSKKSWRSRKLPCEYRRQSCFKDGGIEKRLRASYVYRSTYTRMFKLLFAIDTRLARVGIAVFSCLHFRRSLDARPYSANSPRPDPSIHPSIYLSYLSWVEYLLLYNRILLSPARRTLVARIASIAARVAWRYLVFRLSLETSSRFQTGRGSVLDIIVKIGNKVVFRDVIYHLSWSNENSFSDYETMFYRFDPSRRLIIIALSEEYGVSQVFWKIFILEIF